MRPSSDVHRDIRLANRHAVLAAVLGMIAFILANIQVWAVALAR